MHDGTIWFDTAGCFPDDKKWIGCANKVTIRDTDVSVGMEPGLWTSTQT